MKSFLQLRHNLQLHWKNPINFIFQWLLERFFRKLFCVRAMVKEQKEQKYSPEDVLEKSWYEKFHKIHPKETVIKSFFSLRLYGKRTPLQFFSYDVNKIFQNGCSMELLCTAAFEGIKEPYLIEKLESIFTNHLLLEFINHLLGKPSIRKLPRETSIWRFRWVGGWVLKNYFDVFTVANLQ